MKPIDDWIAYLLLAAGVVVIVWAASTHIVEGDKVSSVEQKPNHIQCLAENIYHEARGEPDAGQVAVAYVTWERAEQEVGQLCKAVWKPNQFSWTSNPVPVTDVTAYAKAMQIATAVVTGKVKNPVPKAMYYHAHWAKPVWRKSVSRVARIGNHVFYQPKEKTGRA